MARLEQDVRCQVNYHAPLYRACHILAPCALCTERPGPLGPVLENVHLPCPLRVRPVRGHGAILAPLRQGMHGASCGKAPPAYPLAMRGVPTLRLGHLASRQLRQNPTRIFKYWGRARCTRPAARGCGQDLPPAHRRRPGCAARRCGMDDRSVRAARFRPPWHACRCLLACLPAGLLQQWQRARLRDRGLACGPVPGAPAQPGAFMARGRITPPCMRVARAGYCRAVAPPGRHKAAPACPAAFNVRASGRARCRCVARPRPPALLRQRRCRGAGMRASAPPRCEG